MMFTSNLRVRKHLFSPFYGESVHPKLGSSGRSAVVIEKVLKVLEKPSDEGLLMAKVVMNQPSADCGSSPWCFAPSVCS